MSRDILMETIIVIGSSSAFKKFKSEIIKDLGYYDRVVVNQSCELQIEEDGYRDTQWILATFINQMRGISAKTCIPLIDARPETLEFAKMYHTLCEYKHVSI